MSAYTLRLCEDRFEPGARTPALPALNRVLYVLVGELSVASDEASAEVRAHSAWHSAAACAVEAGPSGALVLRYELVPGELPTLPLADAALAGIVVRPLLEQPIDLDPGALHLMRCDRVDFAPGAVALPHGHKGGGTRCLIAGRLEVTVGDRPARVMLPGDAWFESGQEPVVAVASSELPTSFVRVSILPRALQGQSSIVYVDPTDAEKSTPRHYTVHVDAPIEIA